MTSPDTHHQLPEQNTAAFDFDSYIPVPEQYLPKPAGATPKQLGHNALLAHPGFADVDNGAAELLDHSINTETTPTMRIKEDADINLTDDEASVPVKIIETMELQNYVRQPPRLEDQAKDTSRQNKVAYYLDVTKPPVEVSEHDAITDFQYALDTVLIHKDLTPDDRHNLEDIRDNLTFMGEKEVVEATRGIGIMWKDYLDQDPDNKLFVVTVDKPDENGLPTKSGPYIVGRILDSFTDEEQARYKGRILDTVEAVVASNIKPDNLRTIVADDSTISGSQMRMRIRELVQTPELKPYMTEAHIQSPLADKDGATTQWITTGRAFHAVEINLLAAHKAQIDTGLDVDGTMVPLKAYYQTHATNGQKIRMTGVAARTTFSYASADYGFRDVIQDAVGHSDSRLPLTEIKRPYRGAQPWVVIEEDGTLRRTNH